MGRNSGLPKLDYIVVEYHLRANLYPPKPYAMAGPCIRAIKYARRGQWDHRIRLPKGIYHKGKKTSSIEDIIEGCRLEWFLD